MFQGFGLRSRIKMIVANAPIACLELVNEFICINYCRLV